MRRIIIDTDTASDDAVAIMMAAADPKVSIDAITVVAGNVNVAQASINARFVLELCNAKVPVYNGCQEPWLHKHEPADWFHGADGMGEQHYPYPKQRAEDAHAVEALIHRFKQEPGEIELVTLGPLTNLATALAMEPELAQWIKHTWVMGGAANTVGNVTPAAEYNIWCDPEAAAKVLQSGLSITLLGWELSAGEAALTDDETQNILALDNPRSTVAIECNAHALQAATTIQQQSGLALADPVAMAVALDESLATDIGHYFVDVSVGNTNTRGMTIVDKLAVTGNAPNARVCHAINIQGWKELLLRSLS